MEKNSEEHRQGTISLYHTQLQDAGPFMKIVLKEAILKLRCTQLKPTHIEKWVIRLEKDFRRIPR